MDVAEVWSGAAVHRLLHQTSCSTNLGPPHRLARASPRLSLGRKGSAGPCGKIMRGEQSHGLTAREDDETRTMQSPPAHRVPA